MRSRVKSTWEVLDRRARLAAHQAFRLATWAARPARFAAPELYSPALHAPLPHLVYQTSIPIARRDPHVDPVLDAGKRRNLALAAPRFDGLLFSAERPLSFWRTLGRVSESRGFTWGMELRGGCVVPAIGGGICLLSNALYELGARADLDIVERHGHSQEAVPPQPGVTLDATVAWPHVDLVLAPRRGAARLGVRVDGDRLELSLHAAEPALPVELSVVDEQILEEHGDRIRINRLVRRRGEHLEIIGENRRRILHAHELGRSCMTCDETACADRPAVVPSLIALGGRRP